MKRKKQKKSKKVFFCSQIKDESGIALVVALLIMVLLTILGTAAIQTTTTDVKISSNFKKSTNVFYAADAGIEAGRVGLNALKVADSGNWDNLLAGNQLIGQNAGVTTLNVVIDNSGGRNVGPATFSLSVADNNDLDGNTLMDIDNIVVLTSTGTYGTAQAQIVAEVRYTGGSQYTQEQYDSGSSGSAAGESVAAAGTQRW